jgi:hypothetical protein
MSNGPVEPTADLRQLANILRQTYLALVQEGFTAQEALVIIGQILAANAAGGGS